MMDVRGSESSCLSDYCGPPPVLLVATSDQASRLARPAIEAAGFRAVAIPPATALDRIADQPAASALWLELDRDGGEDVDHLLDAIEAEGSCRRWPTLISVSPDQIDPVMARIADPQVELLSAPSDSDRIASLSLALARHGGEARLHDIAGEASATRLRQLSDEVGRIAATLARLSTGPDAPTPAEQPAPAPASGLPPVAGETVRQVIRARRLRSRFFDEELFADPAWDMLLDLFQAEIAQHRVPVSSLCIAASVPATTALRWLKTMTEQGIFLRRSDPHDGRRVFVELSPAASEAMRRYFGEVGRPLAV